MRVYGEGGQGLIFFVGGQGGGGGGAGGVGGTIWLVKSFM